MKESVRSVESVQNALSLGLWESRVSLVDMVSIFFYTRFEQNFKAQESSMSNREAKTVWSSDQGDQRKNKALTPGPSPARRGESLPPQQQTAYLHRASGGRGGKVVSLVKNLVLSADDLKALTTRLKQECGAGGTIKDGVIEIQGERREQIAQVLQGLGYKVKIVGG
jgi:translation initiation factor 1